MEQIVMDKSKNPPSRNKVGDASNSIADKQLREAIYTILRHPNNKLPDNDIRVQRSIRHEIREEQTDQLLALFHTYGNRERLDEARYFDGQLIGSPRKVTTNDRVKKRIAELEELNREVES